MLNKRNISSILIFLSFIWIVSIITNNRDEISQIWGNLQPNSFLYLIYATFFVCVAVALLVPLFEIIVYQNTQRKFPLRYLARLFFAGQIVSYLPGRLLGTVYLINETKRNFSALTMVRINIELILTIILFNTFTAFSLIGFFLKGPVVAALTFLLGIIIFVIYHQLNLFDGLLHVLSVILPQKMSEKISQVKTHRAFNLKTIVLMIGILIIHWLAYLYAWISLKKVFIMLDSNIVFLLAAAYTISWIIGFVTLVTPGGLGIREVSFMLICSQYLSQHHASFLSLFLRIWLILVDLLLFLISHAVLKMFPCTIPERK